jgi:hypothetical protein
MKDNFQAIVQVITNILTIAALGLGFWSLSDIAKQQRYQSLLAVYSDLMPQVSVQDFDLVFDGRHLVTLSATVRNLGVLPIRAITLPARLLNCDGSPLQLKTGKATPDGGIGSIEKAEQEDDLFSSYVIDDKARLGPTFLPISEDKLLVNIYGLPSEVEGLGTKLLFPKDLRKTKYNGAIIVVFRFEFFTKNYDLPAALSEVVPDSVSARSFEDEELYSAIEVPDLFVRSSFSVPRAIYIENGIAKKSLTKICETGVSAALQSD